MQIDVIRSKSPTMAQRVFAASVNALIAGLFLWQIGGSLDVNLMLILAQSQNEFSFLDLRTAKVVLMLFFAMLLLWQWVCARTGECVSACLLFGLAAGSPLTIYALADMDQHLDIILVTAGCVCTLITHIVLISVLLAPKRTDRFSAIRPLWYIMAGIAAVTIAHYYSTTAVYSDSWTVAGTRRTMAELALEQAVHLTLVVSCAGMGFFRPNSSQVR